MANNNIEIVDNFVYVWVDTYITKNGSKEAEVTRRISRTNKSYFALPKTFKSKDLDQKASLVIYKIIILSYWSELRVLTGRCKENINTFERRNLSRLLGPIKDFMDPLVVAVVVAVLVLVVVVVVVVVVCLLYTSRCV